MSDNKLEDKQRENSFKIMPPNQEPPPPPSPPSTATASPPSTSSSPPHEFSFAINSLSTAAAAAATGKSSPPPSTAVDLSPADEIFFHGHLLPLHLLSHLPRHSIDHFTLPKTPPNSNNPQTSSSNNDIDLKIEAPNSNNTPKPSSFSLFGHQKQRKNRGDRDKEKHWKKLKFDVAQAVKRYMRMVRPLLTFRNRRNKIDFHHHHHHHHRQAHSFSGTLNCRKNGRDDDDDDLIDFRGFRGGLLYSAPASTRTSPSNSGLLVAHPSSNFSSSSSPSDSTMEELQAAIQAAIAHCKKSISMDEKIVRCPETKAN